MWLILYLSSIFSVCALLCLLLLIIAVKNEYCKNHHQRQLLHHHHQFRHNAAAANSHYWPNTNHKGKAKITKKREQYHNKISKRTILITRETKTTAETLTTQLLFKNLEMMFNQTTKMYVNVPTERDPSCYVQLNISL